MSSSDNVGVGMIVGECCESDSSFARDTNRNRNSGTGTGTTEYDNSNQGNQTNTNGNAENMQIDSTEIRKDFHHMVPVPVSKNAVVVAADNNNPHPQHHTNTNTHTDTHASFNTSTNMMIDDEPIEPLRSSSSSPPIATSSCSPSCLPSAEDRAAWFGLCEILLKKGPSYAANCLQQKALKAFREGIPLSESVLPYFVQHLFNKSLNNNLGNECLTDWCLHLLCGSDAPSVFLRQCRARSAAAAATLCGKALSEGDYVYSCKTCQTSPANVICPACFRDGDHEGHDYVLQLTDGGTCDCGDIGWRPCGVCSTHRHHQEQHAKEESMRQDKAEKDAAERNEEYIRSQVLEYRIHVVLSTLVSYICVNVSALGMGATEQRRFSAVCKLVSWLKKICKGTTVGNALNPLTIAMADAFCSPFEPTLDTTVHSSETLHRITLAVEAKPNQQLQQQHRPTRLPITRIHYLFHFCAQPLPSFSSTRLDRLLSDIVHSLVPHADLRQSVAFAILSPHSIFPNATPHPLYRRLVIAQCKLPSIISSLVLSHSEMDRVIVQQRAIESLIQHLKDVFIIATHVNQIPPSAYDMVAAIGAISSPSASSFLSSLDSPGSGAAASDLPQTTDPDWSDPRQVAIEMEFQSTLNRIMRRRLQAGSDSLETSGTRQVVDSQQVNSRSITNNSNTEPTPTPMSWSNRFINGSDRSSPNAAAATFASTNSADVNHTTPTVNAADAATTSSSPLATSTLLFGQSLPDQWMPNQSLESVSSSDPLASLSSVAPTVWFYNRQHSLSFLLSGAPWNYRISRFNVGVMASIQFDAATATAASLLRVSMLKWRTSLLLPAAPLSIDASSPIISNHVHRPVKSDLLLLLDHPTVCTDALLSSDIMRKFLSMMLIFQRMNSLERKTGAHVSFEKSENEVKNYFYLESMIHRIFDKIMRNGIGIEWSSRQVTGVTGANEAAENSLHIPSPSPQSPSTCSSSCSRCIRGSLSNVPPCIVDSLRSQLHQFCNHLLFDAMDANMPIDQPALLKQVDGGNALFSHALASPSRRVLQCANSVHLPLQRSFTRLLSQLICTYEISFANGFDGIIEFQSQCDELVRIMSPTSPSFPDPSLSDSLLVKCVWSSALSFWLTILDAPLHLTVFMAQLRSKSLWIRNGFDTITLLQKNYKSTSNSWKRGFGNDLAAMQIAAVEMLRHSATALQGIEGQLSPTDLSPADLLVHHIAHRFDTVWWLQAIPLTEDATNPFPLPSSSPPFASSHECITIAEDFFRLIHELVCDRSYFVCDESMLRCFIRHILIAYGDQVTHSQIMQMLPAEVAAEQLHTVDTILQQIANFIPPPSQPSAAAASRCGVYQLKSSEWPDAIAPSLYWKFSSHEMAMAEENLRSWKQRQKDRQTNAVNPDVNGNVRVDIHAPASEQESHKHSAKKSVKSPTEFSFFHPLMAILHSQALHGCLFTLFNLALQSNQVTSGSSSAATATAGHKPNEADHTSTIPAASPPASSSGPSFTTIQVALNPNSTLPLDRLLQQAIHLVALALTHLQFKHNEQLTMHASTSDEFRHQVSSTHVSALMWTGTTPTSLLSNPQSRTHSDVPPDMSPSCMRLERLVGLIEMLTIRNQFVEFDFEMKSVVLLAYHTIGRMPKQRDMFVRLRLTEFRSTNGIDASSAFHASSSTFAASSSALFDSRSEAKRHAKARQRKLLERLSLHQRAVAKQHGLNVQSNGQSSGLRHARGKFASKQKLQPADAAGSAATMTNTMDMAGSSSSSPALSPLSSPPSSPSISMSPLPLLHTSLSPTALTSVSASASTSVSPSLLPLPTISPSSAPASATRADVSASSLLSTARCCLCHEGVDCGSKGDGASNSGLPSSMDPAIARVLGLVCFLTPTGLNAVAHRVQSQQLTSKIHAIQQQQQQQHDQKFLDGLNSNLNPPLPTPRPSNASGHHIVSADGFLKQPLGALTAFHEVAQQLVPASLVSQQSLTSATASGSTATPISFKHIKTERVKGRYGSGSRTSRHQHSTATASLSRSSARSPLPPQTAPTIGSTNLEPPSLFSVRAHHNTNRQHASTLEHDAGMTASSSTTSGMGITGITGGALGLPPSLMLRSVSAPGSTAASSNRMAVHVSGTAVPTSLLSSSSVISGNIHRNMNSNTLGNAELQMRASSSVSPPHATNIQQTDSAAHASTEQVRDNNNTSDHQFETMPSTNCSQLEPPSLFPSSVIITPADSSSSVSVAAGAGTFANSADATSSDRMSASSSKRRRRSAADIIDHANQEEKEREEKENNEAERLSTRNDVNATTDANSSDRRSSMTPSPSQFLVSSTAPSSVAASSSSSLSLPLPPMQRTVTQEVQDLLVEPLDPSATAAAASPMNVPTSPPPSPPPEAIMAPSLNQPQGTGVSVNGAPVANVLNLGELASGTGGAIGPQLLISLDMEPLRIPEQQFNEVMQHMNQQQQQQTQIQQNTNLAGIDVNIRDSPAATLRLAQRVVDVLRSHNASPQSLTADAATTLPTASRNRNRVASPSVADLAAARNFSISSPASSTTAANPSASSSSSASSSTSSSQHITFDWAHSLGLHLQTCNQHYLHIGCLENYLSSKYGRASNTLGWRQGAPFLCPACRRLSNVVIPITVEDADNCASTNDLQQQDHTRDSSSAFNTSSASSPSVPSHYSRLMSRMPPPLMLAVPTTRVRLHSVKRGRNQENSLSPSVSRPLFAVSPPMIQHFSNDGCSPPHPFSLSPIPTSSSSSHSPVALLNPSILSVEWRECESWMKWIERRHQECENQAVSAASQILLDISQLTSQPAFAPPSTAFLGVIKHFIHIVSYMLRGHSNSTSSTSNNSGSGNGANASAVTNAPAAMPATVGAVVPRNVDDSAVNRTARQLRERHQNNRITIGTPTASLPPPILGNNAASAEAIPASTSSASESTAGGATRDSNTSQTNFNNNPTPANAIANANVDTDADANTAAATASIREPVSDLIEAESRLQQLITRLHQHQQPQPHPQLQSQLQHQPHSNPAAAMEVDGNDNRSNQPIQMHDAIAGSSSPVSTTPAVVAAGAAASAASNQSSRSVGLSSNSTSSLRSSIHAQNHASVNTNGTANGPPVVLPPALVHASVPSVIATAAASAVHPSIVANVNSVVATPSFTPSSMIAYMRIFLCIMGNTCSIRELAVRQLQQQQPQGTPSTSNMNANTNASAIANVTPIAGANSKLSKPLLVDGVIADELASSSVFSFAPFAASLLSSHSTNVALFYRSLPQYLDTRQQLIFQQLLMLYRLTRQQWRKITFDQSRGFNIAGAGAGAGSGSGSGSTHAAFSSAALSSSASSYTSSGPMSVDSSPSFDWCSNPDSLDDTLFLWQLLVGSLYESSQPAKSNANPSSSSKSNNSIPHDNIERTIHSGAAIHSTSRLPGDARDTSRNGSASSASILMASGATTPSMKSVPPSVGMTLPLLSRNIFSVLVQFTPILLRLAQPVTLENVPQVIARMSDTSNDEGLSDAPSTVSDHILGLLRVLYLSVIAQSVAYVASFGIRDMGPHGSSKKQERERAAATVGSVDAELHERLNATLKRKSHSPVAPSVSPLPFVGNPSSASSSNNGFDGASLKKMKLERGETVPLDKMERMASGAADEQLEIVKASDAVEDDGMQTSTDDAAEVTSAPTTNVWQAAADRALRLTSPLTFHELLLSTACIIDVDSLPSLLLFARAVRLRLIDLTLPFDLHISQQRERQAALKVDARCGSNAHWTQLTSPINHANVHCIVQQLISPFLRQSALYLSALFQSAQFAEGTKPQAESDSNPHSRTLLDFARIFPSLYNESSLDANGSPSFGWSVGPSGQRLLYLWYQGLFLPVWAKRAMATGINQHRQIVVSKFSSSVATVTTSTQSLLNHSPEVNSQLPSQQPLIPSNDLLASIQSQFRAHSPPLPASRQSNSSPSSRWQLASPPRLSSAVPRDGAAVVSGSPPNASRHIFDIRNQATNNQSGVGSNTNSNTEVEKMAPPITASTSVSVSTLVPSSTSVSSSSSRWLLSPFVPYQQRTNSNSNTNVNSNVSVEPRVPSSISPGVRSPASDLVGTTSRVSTTRATPTLQPATAIPQSVSHSATQDTTNHANGFSSSSSSRVSSSSSTVSAFPPFPCVSGDGGDRFSFCGLQHEFHSYLSDPEVRTCVQCKTRKYALHNTVGTQNLALCLLCGSTVCLQTPPAPANSTTPPSKCFLHHLLKCDGRIGLFLVWKRGGEVLCLLHSSGGTAACFWPSLYVDRYGESDVNLQRGTPLFLHEGRRDALIQHYTSMSMQDHITSHAVPALWQQLQGNHVFGNTALVGIGVANALGGTAGINFTMNLPPFPTARNIPLMRPLQLPPHTTVNPDGNLMVSHEVLRWFQPPEAVNTRNRTNSDADMNSTNDDQPPNRAGRNA